MRNVSAVLIASLALSACTASKATVTEGSSESLPFIEDDYGKAVQVAQQKKLPIFADAWAPW